MSARLHAIVLAVAMAFGITVVPTNPAGAVAGGAGSFEFQVNGTLNPFPGTLATTYFSGQGTGAAQLDGTGSDGGTYHADITSVAMQVSGRAVYNEPTQFPLCPLFGSAFPLYGKMYVQSNPGSVSGIAYKAGTFLTGSVTALWAEYEFQYNRVGNAATLVVLNGRATIQVAIPGTGYQYITAPFSGAGAGVLVIDPVQASANCLNRGGPALPYSLIGDVTLGGAG